MRVLFFGTYDDQRSPRALTLREGFAAHGHEVAECVVRLGFSHEQRVSMFRRPWLIPIMATRLAGTWLWLLVRSRRYRRPDVVVVGYMGHLDVHVARLRYPRTPIVLDHLVSLVGTAGDRGADRRGFVQLLAAADRAALGVSNVVAVDTEEHLDELPAAVRSRGIVVPVGAQERMFAASDLQAAALPPPPLRVVFYGHYIPLQGAPVIGAAAAELARRGRHDICFTMIGRGQELGLTREAATGAANIEWIDRIVGRDELAELVRHHHVAIGIAGTTAKAAKVVPTKVFEAAATGLAIVTADTAPQRRALGDAAVFVQPGDPQALADALEALADEPDRVAQLATAARDVAESRFRPGAVVAPLLERLEPVLRP